MRRSSAVVVGQLLVATVAGIAGCRSGDPTSPVTVGEWGGRVSVTEVGPWSRSVSTAGGDVHWSGDGRRLLYVMEEGTGRRWYVDGEPGPLTTTLELHSPMWGRTHQHVRYPAHDGPGLEGKVRLFVDLAGGPPFDEIDDYSLNADGTRIAYFARDAEEWLPIVDHVVVGAGFVEKGFIRWSPDGEHVAWHGRRADGWHAAFDGEEIGPYDEIEHVEYSEDGRERRCYARNGGGWHVIVNGQKAYEGRWSWFSANGRGSRRGALVLHSDPGFQVVVDGKASPVYDALIHPYSGGDQAVAFSSDGRRYAYPCYHHGAAHVVVDGVEGPPYEEVCVPAFSPDGQRVTYGARRNGRWHVVVDGIEGPACDGISAPKFTGNGSRVAYSGRRGSRWYVMAGDREFASGNDPIYPTVSSAGDHVAWREQRDARWIVFLDGVGGLASDAKECQLSFSPDGSRLAYTIERDGRWHVVVDGDVVPGAGHTGIGYWGRRGPFSPDGKRWAYKAKHVGAWSGARWSVVTDRIEGPIYKTADSPAFSPDSQHVVYRATRRVRADEAQQHDDGRHPSDSALVNVIVVDHEEGPGFRMAHLYRPPFENDGSAGYFAATQKGLFRVTHVPPMPAEE